MKMTEFLPLSLSEFQVRGGTEDNLNIVFLFSQPKHML